MVIGHLAPAIVVRARYSELPITALLLTTYAADMVATGLSLSGVGQVAAGQWSHSVPVVAALGLAVLIALRLAGKRSDAALAAFIVALSHVPLDWITGDAKPLFFPTGPTVGLHLYRHAALDWFVESSLCVVAWAWWSAPRRGKAVAWSGVGLISLLVFQGVLISYSASHSIIELFERGFAALAGRSVS